MAEVIQFNCPVCATMLRLPLTMAAQQGPCPHCAREIIAPDPRHGIGAYELPVAVPEVSPFRLEPFAESPPLVAKPQKVIEPFRPFAEPLPQRETDEFVQIPEPMLAREPFAATQPTSPTAPQPITVCAKPQRAVLVLSCLLTGAVALAWGYALGVRSNQWFMRIPPMTAPMIPPPKVDNPTIPADPKLPAAIPVAEPTIRPIKPPVEPPKPPEPAKVSAAAEASLRAFLDAPDWATRSAYVLSPGKVRTLMEAYSHEAPDGPTVFQSLSVKQSHLDEKSGNTVYIFNVVTEKYPDGIPVAIKETPAGWLVDWQSFVEFRDNLFHRFVIGPVDQTGRFHLVVTAPPPARAANTENEKFSSFLLQSPLADKQQLAFVKKPSKIFDTFQTATANGAIFTPVIEVVKHKTTAGQNYFEVTDIIVTDWLPKEN